VTGLEHIPPPIAHADHVVDSMTLRVSEEHLFEIEVYLKWMMCYEELDTFEDIPIV